jgi:hypothetical protein
MLERNTGRRPASCMPMATQAELHLDREPRDLFPQPAVVAIPAMKVFQRPQNPAGDHTETTHLFFGHLTALQQQLPNGAETESLDVARTGSSEALGEAPDPAVPELCRRGGKNRHTHDNQGVGSGDPVDFGDCVGRILQVFENLLGDDDVEEVVFVGSPCSMLATLMRY